MVYQDGFRVSLFNPVTNQSHKEFYKDGNVYVEAEPDAEYFVDVELTDQHLVPGGPRRLEVHVLVDGKDLGWRHFLSRPGATLREGLRDDHGKRAFAFALPKLGYVPKVASTQKGGSPSAESFKSQVIVCVHESVEKKPGVFKMPCPTCEQIAALEEDSDESDDDLLDNDFSLAAPSKPKPKEVKLFKPTTKEVKIHVPSTANKAALVKKKEMRSVAGKTTIPKKVTPPAAPKKAVITKFKPASKPPLAMARRWVPPPHVRGKHVTTITIKYCSTVGLIVAGVLPKPHPDWMPPGHSPYSADTTMSVQDMAAARAKLEKITKTISYKDDNGLQHQAFQLDLTELSDDDDN